MSVPTEVVDGLTELGRVCNGDVPALITAARGVAPGPFSDDALLARGCEDAAERAAQRGDRGGAWWLACAVATLRASPLASPQEEAELVVARVTGELSRSPAALGPLPDGARWLVAGQPEVTADALELARRNATTYLERLEAELAGRAAPLRAKWEQAPVDDLRAAIEEALGTYLGAMVRTRAGLSRVVDQIVAKGGDAQRARATLEELDDVVAPTLGARVAEVRAMLGAPIAAPEPPLESGMDRPSFAGAAPPAFRAGQQGAASAPSAVPPVPPVPPIAMVAAVASVEELDAAMRAAFERAWASPDPMNMGAFETAVRARYERETASIPDPDQRKQALDHYVAHAMAQLQRT